MCLSMALGIGFYFRVEKFKLKFFSSNSSGLQIDSKEHLYLKLVYNKVPSRWRRMYFNDVIHQLAKEMRSIENIIYFKTLSFALSK